MPINEIAKELGSAKVGNMVMLGALIRSTIIVSEASIEVVMKKLFTGEKARAERSEHESVHVYKIKRMVP